MDSVETKFGVVNLLESIDCSLLRGTWIQLKEHSGKVALEVPIDRVLSASDRFICVSLDCVDNLFFQPLAILFVAGPTELRVPYAVDDGLGKALMSASVISSVSLGQSYCEGMAAFTIDGTESFLLDHRQFSKTGVVTTTPIVSSSSRRWWSS